MAEFLNDERGQRIVAALSEHCDVKDARTFQMQDETGASIIVTAVVPEVYANAVEIREALRSQVGAADCPDAVALVDQIPTHSEDEAGSESLASLISNLADTQVSRYVCPENSLETELQEMLLEVVDIPRVGVTDGFIDLGADSATVVQLSTIIEERYGCSITPDAIFDAANIRALAWTIRKVQ